MNPVQWERWEQTTGIHSGYGICQWTPSQLFFDKKTLTPSKANKIANNNPVKLLKMQLNYMWYTMTTKNYKKGMVRRYGEKYIW